MEKYPFKTKPFAHQLDCWDRSKDKESFAILAEMGTGKTKMLIDSAAWLYDQGKIDSLLVIAPKGVYRNWWNRDTDGKPIGEIVTHMPEHVRYYATYWDTYQTQAKLREYQTLFNPSEDFHILVMNVEALSTNNGYDFAKKFLRCHTAMMAIDESTTIKNPKSTCKRSKAAVTLGGIAKYRRILSGMPVTRSPLDLYNQCMFLDWHLLGFSSFFSFRNRYALVQKMQLGQRVFDKIIGYQRLDELTDKLAMFSYRITKDECLDLPAKVYVTREVELTTEQQKYYTTLKNQALLQLQNSSIVTAPMVMTRLQKLHEIVCGFIKDPDSGDIEEIPNNRIAAVLEILEEADCKVIIWSNNTHDIHAIHKAIAKEYGPQSVAKFHGDTRPDEREIIKQNFQDPNNELRYLVMNQATGRFGVTLTEAKIMVYYSNSYDLEHRTQSEDRAHRIGQTEHLTIIDLITRKTVDERIIKLLREKKQLSDLIMRTDYKDWLI